MLAYAICVVSWRKVPAKAGPKISTGNLTLGAWLVQGVMSSVRLGRGATFIGCPGPSWESCPSFHIRACRVGHTVPFLQHLDRWLWCGDDPSFRNRVCMFYVTRISGFVFALFHSVVFSRCVCAPWRRIFEEPNWQQIGWFDQLGPKVFVRQFYFILPSRVPVTSPSFPLSSGTFIRF